MAAPWETTAAPATVQPTPQGAPWEADAKQAGPNAGTDMRQGSLLSQFPSGVVTSGARAIDAPSDMLTGLLSGPTVGFSAQGAQGVRDMATQHGALSPEKQGLPPPENLSFTLPSIDTGPGAVQKMRDMATAHGAATPEQQNLPPAEGLQTGDFERALKQQGVIQPGNSSLAG